MEIVFELTDDRWRVSGEREDAERKHYHKRNSRKYSALVALIKHFTLSLNENLANARIDKMGTDMKLGARLVSSKITMFALYEYTNSSPLAREYVRLYIDQV